MGRPAFRVAIGAATTRLVTAPAGALLEFDVARVRGQTTLTVSLPASSATNATADISQVSMGTKESAR